MRQLQFRMVSVAVLLLLGLAVLADEPKKPQWRRVLEGDDAKTAAKLRQQIEELAGKDNYAGAIKTAEEFLELRTQRQGEEGKGAVTLGGVSMGNRTRLASTEAQASNSRVRRVQSGESRIG